MQLPLSAIKTLLTTCHEAKRITELQPPLPQGLTPGNIKVLDYIEQLGRNDKPPKVSDIANMLQVTRPGITRLVRELEAIDAIEKVTDEQDKRIIRLRLTSTGHKLHAYYITQYHGWLASQITNISEEDINTTANTIAKLYAIMSNHKPILEGNAPSLKEGKNHD